MCAISSTYYGTFTISLTVLKIYEKEITLKKLCSHFLVGDSYIISEGGSSLSRSPLRTIEAVKVGGGAARSARGAAPARPELPASMHGNQPLQRRNEGTLYKIYF